VSRYEVDPSEVDAIGLVQRRDRSGVIVDELTENQAREFCKALKSHLYTCHGLDTSRMTNRATLLELEFVHYELHKVGAFKQGHTHGHIDYLLRDMSVQLSVPTERIADVVVNRFRFNLEARRKREE
jgi:hypothetical protein